MILLDTTVLGYAVGDDHPLRAPARQLLDSIPDLSVAVTTTVEVIQEFAHVRAQRTSRADAVRLAREYLRALKPISTTADDLSLGMDFYEQTLHLGSFDCVLAAVAVNRDADALVSGDRAFAAIGNLRWIDLGSKALLSLLERSAS